MRGARYLPGLPAGTEGTMPRSAAMYQRVPFLAAMIVERPQRVPRTFPDASRIPLISKRAVRDRHVAPKEAHVGQGVRELRPLVDPAPLLREGLLDLVAAARGSAGRADVVAVGQPQGGQQLGVALVPRVLHLRAELADVAVVLPTTGRGRRRRREGREGERRAAFEGPHGTPPWAEGRSTSSDVSLVRRRTDGQGEIVWPARANWNRRPTARREPSAFWAEVRAAEQSCRASRAK